MRKAGIIVNAYTQSEAELNQPKRIREELLRRGVRAELIRSGAAELDGAPLDFYVYLDKDKYAARLLEKRARLFNRAEAIELCDDKMLTCLALDGFPMPDTIPSVLCYTPNTAVSEEFLNRIESRLGYPVIVKECFGSLGKGVYRADTRAELRALSERLLYRPHLYQKFIRESCGRDVRVIVIGGKIILSMLRSSDGDFRSNAALGGRGEPYTLSEKDKELCTAVSRRLGLDYCGIDLLFSDRGFLICEVNSNAFFRTAEQVTGINVAGAYAEYMIGEVYGG